MIEAPLPSLDAWTEALASRPIPVLPGTLAELAQLADIEERLGNLDAHTIADSLGGDPLMTLQVLVTTAQQCLKRDAAAPETFVGATVMLGIGPFFRAFQGIPSITDWLHDHPEAISGLLKVITRARRGSHLTTAFALRRQDEDVMVLQEGALLHDFAEMLLWCHAPKLALEVSRRLRDDHTLRSADVQQDVLGLELGALAQALMAHWHLPPLLAECTNDRQAHSPRVRTVMLGLQIARHTQYGWDDPHAQAALPDDIAEVAQLLTLSYDAAQRLLMSMDV
mgnify:CR=1 FL=1